MARSSPEKPQTLEGSLSGHGSGGNGPPGSLSV
jgi:hypothetical protein